VPAHAGASAGRYSQPSHGVPENLALGVSLVEGTSVTLRVAIFFSNLPESLVGALAMRDGGRGSNAVLGLWAACALLLAAAASPAGHSQGRCRTPCSRSPSASPAAR
jgi:ZIP family zinc transporter